MSRTAFNTYQIVLVICRNFDGKWLAVNETKGRGWWIPGGFVDSEETFIQAAHRETMEEAGIEITLKGILRVEHSLQYGNNVRMRVIFFAEPKDDKQKPKSVPDKESLEGRWVTLEEFKNIGSIRGEELLEWGHYIENGGQIFPMGLLGCEYDSVPKPDKNKAITQADLPAKDYEQNRAAEIYGLIKKQDTDGLRKFLSENKSFKIDTPISKKLLTPLYKAIKWDCPLDFIKILLEYDADVTYLTLNKRNAFHYAARQNDEKILKLLLGSLIQRKIPAKKQLDLLHQVETDYNFKPQEMIDHDSDQFAYTILNEYIKNIENSLSV